MSTACRKFCLHGLCIWSNYMFMQYGNKEALEEECTLHNLLLKYNRRVSIGNAIIMWIYWIQLSCIMPDSSIAIHTSDVDILLNTGELMHDIIHWNRKLSDRLNLNGVKEELQQVTKILRCHIASKNTISLFEVNINVCFNILVMH